MSPLKIQGKERFTGLGPARGGYNYQDSVTAFHLALSLTGKYGAIGVECKETQDDRFDDLSIRADSRVVRRQIKSSKKADRPFELQDLTTVRSQLEIDSLIRSYRAVGEQAADEYRLCATWKEPTDPKLRNLLEAITEAPTFDGYQTKLYRLKSDLIWPDGDIPIWGRLREAKDIARKHFLDFAARFVIELECPTSSNNPSTPGELERLLCELLTNTIGIGRYPNHTRTTADVAAQLVQMAAQARAAGRTLTASEVEVEIHLRKDFCRVAQQFPVVKAVEVKRSALLNVLRNESGTATILVGAPGSGKSWVLTDLADALEKEGHLVARHYCYLEPGDREVQRRITTNVLFANLIFDLIHARPELRAIHQPIYSAGPHELEDLLRKGAEQGIIADATLIVDGVDHISRVFAESKDLSREEVDIIEELAALKLPLGIRLVIGSQPGEHLEPLSTQSVTIEMPAWVKDEIAALAENLNVLSALSSAGFDGLIGDFLEEISQRCEGNPLYGTFLCRHILTKLATNAVFDPIEALRDAPLIDGQISRYYQYLLAGLEAGNTAGVVADLLGLVDFALTEQEIKTILRALAHRIPQALSHLSPVLTEVSGQGGVRVFHESFRRFIVERLNERGARTAEVIAPVIDWLIRRDFYQDAKAYRFLLPCLRRAGRNAEALLLVNAEFVSWSVYAGHSRKAIEENLKLATYIAAEEADWSALARCAELRRSCITCFEEKLLDPESFGRAYATVFGAAALNERLLFDGRPTFPASVGLVFCSLCDDAGEVPPWEPYLDLGREIERPASKGGHGNDSAWDKLAIAEAHGELRLQHGEDIFESLSSYIGQIESPRIDYLRSLIRRVVQFSGTSTLKRLINESRMNNQTRSILLIELARTLMNTGEGAAAREAATHASRETHSIELAAECLTLGADASEIVRWIPDLNSIQIAVDGGRSSLETTSIRQWVVGVKIAAVARPEVLDLVRNKVDGVGWYRAWLCFVVSLAVAEAKFSTDPKGAQEAVVNAFAALAADTRPFVGTPRACDLYFIHGIIHETIARGLRLLCENEAWKEALTHLENISRGTTTYLQRSPDGPLTPEAFVSILMPFLSHSHSGSTGCVLDTMREQLKHVEKGGELYEVHANLELLVARALAIAGLFEEARARWRSASVHLCAYGFRKDTTIFEFIDSVEWLARTNNEGACTAMAALQPLVNAVVDHTDGKFTRYAPARWAGELAKIDPVGASLLVAHSLAKRGGAIDWRYEDAAARLLQAVSSAADPKIAFFLDATLSFNGETADAERRLKTLDRLYGQEPASEHALRLLAAQIHGDSERFNEMAWARVADFAAIRQVSLPRAELLSAESAAPHTTEQLWTTDPWPWFEEQPVFASGAAPISLLTEIRQRHRSLGDQPARKDRFVNALGYRLAEMVDSGNEDEAIRLVRYFARESYFGTGAIPLADLAEGLERHGYDRVASVSYALAYASSRGDGGSTFLGGSNFLHWAARAFALSSQDATRTVTTEIAHLLTDQEYFLGLTGNLVELLALVAPGPETAFKAWAAGLGVVLHRLPNNENDDWAFDEIYLPHRTSDWSLNEALALLLLARVNHPELRRKTAALAGFAAVASKDPSVLVRPLREFLSIDTPISSALIILAVLVETEVSPYPITLALSDELEALCHSRIFGLESLAGFLLQRVGRPIERNEEDHLHTSTIQLPERRERAVLTLDWGDRVEDISTVWPDFSRLVARRFYDLWEVPSMRDRSRYRHEAATSIACDGLPETPMLFWEQELFETAFHEILNGIDRHIRRYGQSVERVRSDIVLRVVPRVRLHVAHWNSRTPRPQIPLPADQRDGAEVVLPITGGDEYDGWFRCGYFERQLVVSGKLRCSDTVTVMEGIEFPKALGTHDPTITPLSRGDGEAWWESYEGPLPRSRFVGQVVGIDFVKDWLGEIAMLGIDPSLVAGLNLHGRSSWQDQLALDDRSGATAVVFRSWTVRPVGDRIDEENRILEGCDLLMRPDVFEEMRRSGRHPPLTVRWTSQRNSETRRDT